MKLSRTVRAGLVAMAFTWAAAGAIAQAQNEEISAACTLKNDLYTCDKGRFEQVFAQAKTAAIETATTDAVAQNSLKKLIAASGKTLVDRSAHPDLTFLLVPTDQGGVQYTSNRSALAGLRVYAADPQKAGRGALVWVENFTGEGDTPWPMVVGRLTGQFKTQFVSKH